MNNKFSLRSLGKRAAALFLVPLILTGCTVKSVIAEPSKTVGVGRAAENVIADAERVEVMPDGALPVVNEQPPLTGTDVSSAGDGKISWTFKNGKYSYTFPEPDRGTLSDLTDVNNTSRAFLRIPILQTRPAHGSSLRHRGIPQPVIPYSNGAATAIIQR